MALFEHIGLAAQALRANWLRGLLTALGVIIGVASLVTLTAISAGAQAGVDASLQRLGPNIIILDGEFVTQENGQQTTTDRTITDGDLKAIAALPGIVSVAPRVLLEQPISSGRHKFSGRLFALTPTFLRIHNYAAGQGRLLNASDSLQGRPAIVLGPAAASELFPGGGSPLGRIVRIQDREFTVIGSYASKGSLGGENLDRQSFVPLEVARRTVFGGEKVNGADIQVASQSEINPTKDLIDELLLKRHRIQPGRAEDFSTEDQQTLITTAAAATSTFQTLTLALGVMALVMGGIGIMNIMLVSVTERTREIGIRKALGADSGRIQTQFLIEALALCFGGGVIGLGIGVAVASLVSRLAGWQTLISPSSLVIAFTASIAVGLVFGFFPARRAAAMPPAVAMRYD
jgi:putative ABC transport system permease protein